MGKLRKWWRRLLGYHTCPLCEEQSLKWAKVSILFADEPPLFGHFVCYNCGASSPVESLPWADAIAKDYGHQTYKEALESTMRKDKDV